MRLAPANPVRCPQSAPQPLARLASMISAKLRRGHALSAEHEFGAQASRVERVACAKKIHGTHIVYTGALSQFATSIRYVWLSARCSFCFAARFDFLPRLQFSAHSQRPQGGGRAVEGMDEECQQRGRDRRSERRAVSGAMEILGMYSQREAVAVRVVAAIWLRFAGCVTPFGWGASQTRTSKNGNASG